MLTSEGIRRSFHPDNKAEERCSIPAIGRRAEPGDERRRPTDKPLAEAREMHLAEGAAMMWKSAPGDAHSKLAGEKDTPGGVAGRGRGFDWDRFLGSIWNNQIQFSH
jgi:hypothetical protein